MTALFVLAIFAVVIGVVAFVSVKLINAVFGRAKPDVLVPAFIAADHHSYGSSIDDAPFVPHSSMVNYSMCDSLFLDSKSDND